jgi:hypothetical protein
MARQAAPQRSHASAHRAHVAWCAACGAQASWQSLHAAAQTAASARRCVESVLASVTIARQSAAHSNVVRAHVAIIVSPVASVARQCA